MVDVSVEDAVGFEIPGEQEEDGHDSGRPAKELHGEGFGDAQAEISSRCASIARFLESSVEKSQTAYEGDSGGDQEHSERVVEALPHVGFRAEKCRMEDGQQGDHAGEKGERLGEFEQHAANLGCLQ